MGVHVLRDKHESCLYCSTSMFAFGPIFYEGEEPDEFLDWLVADPRGMTDKELEQKVTDWRDLLEQEQEKLTGHRGPCSINEDDSKVNR